MDLGDADLRLLVRPILGLQLLFDDAGDAMPDGVGDVEPELHRELLEGLVL